MQKLQSLDVNFSILGQYVDELNSRYGNILKELDDDIAKKDALLEKDWKLIIFKKTDMLVCEPKFYFPFILLIIRYLKFTSLQAGQWDW